jgi:hypothetical protein
MHEDVAVLWRWRPRLEMVEKGLFCTEHLNRACGKSCQTHAAMGFDAQASSEEWTEKRRK